MTRIAARVAMMAMGSLIMVGCAMSGDEVELLDEGATKEVAQEIDAVAPVAPQDPSTGQVVEAVEDECAEEITHRYR